MARPLRPTTLALAALPLWLSSCSVSHWNTAHDPRRTDVDRIVLGVTGAAVELDRVELDRGSYAAVNEALSRVLIVVAHPDDELVAAGLTYLHGARRGGIVDVLTITDGQGGFKYASYAEARTGVPYTDEKTGRELLPALRLEEQTAALELLGARDLYRLDELDHGYTRDRNEVLAENAGIWDLSRVRRCLDGLQRAKRYDLIVTLSPTDRTHGHHQAATLLAVEAAARAEDGNVPVVLCCEVHAADDEGIGTPPAVLEDALLARLADSVGPFVVDRTRPFGHADKMNLKSICAVAVAQHLSQGTMLNYIGRGDLEEYWVFRVSPDDAAERCADFFERLEAGPRFAERDYAPTARPAR